MSGAAYAGDGPAEPQSVAVTAPAAVDLDVFRGARFLGYPEGNLHPMTEERDRGEGWVELNRMIDSNFEPARRGDTPIDSSRTWTFRMDHPDMGASVSFVSAYK